MVRPGTLKALVQRSVETALASGALVTLETHSELIEDGGVPFVVRILSSRLRKEQSAVFQALPEAQRVNPFLPYDPDLYVADLSPTHVCLLNKYNVVERHLLMVTREFEAQDVELTLEDFYTIALCLREYDGLAFYNSDKTAGASQPHKHLQFVPLEDDPLFRELPVERLFQDAATSLGSISVPFRHAVRCLLGTDLNGNATAKCHERTAQGTDLYDTAGTSSEPDIIAEGTDLYELNAVARQLLQAYGELHSEVLSGPGSHNLLVTRRWMMIVPRSRESYRSISVNALGYSGSLLVKNSEELSWIRDAGPMRVLRSCAVDV